MYFSSRYIHFDDKYFRTEGVHHTDKHNMSISTKRRAARSTDLNQSLVPEEEKQPQKKSHMLFFTPLWSAILLLPKTVELDLDGRSGKCLKAS